MKISTVSKLGAPLAAWIVCAACWAAHPIEVPDYTVYVDKPTGYAFVRLPGGWKFVGKIDPADLGRLPPNVVTALLARDADDDDGDRRNLAARDERPPAP